MNTLRLPQKYASVTFMIGAIFVGISAGILAAWISSFWDGQEDAYITYCYAKHLASGQGFVFWAGAKPSLGTTTPLFTLILAVFAWLGLPPHVVSPWIGVFCHAAIAILLVILAREFMGRWLSLIAGLYWALGLAWFFRLGGMETPFLILLLVGLALSETRAPASGLSAVLLGMLILCRPDSLLIFVFCFGFWILTAETKNYVVRNMLIVSLITLPWILYAARTFHSVVPSSLIAKLIIPNQSGIINLDSFYSEYFPFPAFLPLVIAICLLGAISIWRERAELRPFLAWIPSYYISFRLGGAPDFAWYYVPPLFLVPVLLNRGLLVLARPLTPNLRLPSLFIFVLLAILLWLKANLITTFGLRSLPQDEPVHKQLALFVRQKAEERDFTASMEVGMLSYYSDRPVLDLLGFTNPEVLKWSRMRDFEGIIHQYRPRFLMAVGMNGSALGYREIMRKPYFIGDYLIWERIQE